MRNKTRSKPSPTSIAITASRSVGDDHFTGTAGRWEFDLCLDGIMGVFGDGPRCAKSFEFFASKRRPPTTRFLAIRQSPAAVIPTHRCPYCEVWIEEFTAKAQLQARPYGSDWSDSNDAMEFGELAFKYILRTLGTDHAYISVRNLVDFTDGELDRS